VIYIQHTVLRDSEIMSELVCFHRNEKISCDDICPNDGYFVMLLAFFMLIALILIIALLSKQITSCFYYCFSSPQFQRVNRYLNTDPVDKQIQCDVDCGLQTVTIHPDNSICILSEFDHDELGSL
jgi:hypothetical protein